MVIANVLNIYTTVAGLWQYDYGQILRLQGIKLPTAVEIHFSLQEKGGESVTRIGTTKDGVTDVVIPDSMLENDATTMDYKIYAFVYLADSESGQTEYKISISVKSRPKPESFEKPEDAELFRQAITEVNNSAEVALQSKKEAEQSKTAAETAAQQAAQSKTDIDNIKSDIEEAAKGENVSQIQKNMNDIGSLKESLEIEKNHTETEYKEEVVQLEITEGQAISTDGELYSSAYARWGKASVEGLCK